MPYWKIYNGVAATGSPVFTSDEESTYDMSVEKLKVCLELINVPGKYVIQFKEKWNDNKINNSYRFDVPYLNSSSSNFPALQPTHIGSGYQSKTDVMELLRKERQDWEHVQTNKELKKELKEALEKIGKLKKDKEHPITALTKMLEPYLPYIIPYMAGHLNPGGPQVAIAGLSAQAVPQYERQSSPENETKQRAEVNIRSENHQASPEEEARLQQEDAINRHRMNEVMNWLISTEGDLTKGIDLLHLMMTRAKDNPVLIISLKQFLNG